MKQISLILLILFFDCKSSTKTKQNTSLEFPFAKNFKQFKQKKFNKFEEGDCWGNARNFINNSSKIITDSTNCGDYGYHYTFFYLENDTLKLVHKKDVSRMIIENEFILSETILDFRKDNNLIYKRIDTTTSDNFSLLKKKYIKSNIANSDSIFNEYNLEHKSLWIREISN